MISVYISVLGEVQEMFLAVEIVFEAMVQVDISVQAVTQGD